MFGDASRWLIGIFLRISVPIGRHRVLAWTAWWLIVFTFFTLLTYYTQTYDGAFKSYGGTPIPKGDWDVAVGHGLLLATIGTFVPMLLWWMIKPRD